VLLHYIHFTGHQSTLHKVGGQIRVNARLYIADCWACKYFHYYVSCMDSLLMKSSWQWN